MMKLTQEAVDLVKSHEGLRLNAYPDPAHGWKVPTIGYGHTSAAGAPKVYKGLTITMSEAEAILAKDMTNVMESILPLITAPVNRNQVGALVSFTFNLGIGNFQKSTLLKKLNAEDYEGAANEFRRWNKAAGKVMRGLVRRRAEEEALFRTPVGKAAAKPIVVSEPVAPKGIDKPMMKSKTVWATILSSVTGMVTALSALDWKVAIFIVAVIALAGFVIFRERHRHAKEARAIIEDIGA